MLQIFIKLCNRHAADADDNIKCIHTPRQRSSSSIHGQLSPSETNAIIASYAVRKSSVSWLWHNVKCFHVNKYIITIYHSNILLWELNRLSALYRISKKATFPYVSKQTRKELLFYPFVGCLIKSFCNPPNNLTAYVICSINSFCNCSTIWQNMFWHDGMACVCMSITTNCYQRQQAKINLEINSIFYSYILQYFWSRDRQ